MVMSFRTITARYDGTCRRCSTPIHAGTRIRFGGRGMTYHLSAECPAGAGVATAAFPQDAAIADRVSVARNYRGEVIGYRNARGRCEDAPCCGCCS